MEPGGYSYGTPSLEFLRYRNFNKTKDIESMDDVELRDLVVALFQAADAIWDELRAIRVALESKR
jgi:hypothetical protein